MKPSIAKYSNSTMTLLLLTIFVVMVAISSTYPAGARFMTFVVGLPAIALCLLQLALDVRERGRTADAAGTQSETGMAGHASRLEAIAAGQGSEADLDPKTKLRRELIVWGYFLGLIGGILLFGFHISVPVFLFTFLRFYAKASWITSLAATAVASAVMYVAFEQVLRITLHPGFLTDDIRTFLNL